MFKGLVEATSEVAVVVAPKSITEKEEKYFTNLINSIICYQDAIQFGGRIKELYMYNPFTTIINEGRWSMNKKNVFELYVTMKFGSPDLFNQWIFSNRTKNITGDKFNITFRDVQDFNLIFVKVNNSYLECYARDGKWNNQVKYLDNSRSSRFYLNLVQYMKEIQHLKAIQHIRNNTKIAQALEAEISRGWHIIKTPLKLISNNKKDYCLAYINLNKLENEPHPAWDEFINQFINDAHREMFMAWIYSIFVDDDMGRQVLWLEGAGYSGKSTVVRVIANALLKYNDKLFKTIADKNSFDRFSLEGFEYCRLASFAEANEPEFFKRRDILTLSGGDFVTINRKNMPAITRKLMVKIIVHSNYAPKIDYRLVHERTRLLHIKIDPKKINLDKRTYDAYTFENHLSREFYSFLASCKAPYDRHIGKDGLLHFEAQ